MGLCGRVRAYIVLGTITGMALAACGGGNGSAASGASPDGFAVACQNPNGWKVIEPGEPGVSIFAPVEAMQAWRQCAGTAATSADLAYGGGTGGVGVEAAPAVYLVLWGSQWSSDPSGEAGILQSFLDGVGGSGWQNTVTQYCEGVASGTIFCNGTGTAAGNRTGELLGVWLDEASAAPTHPRQGQLANEAIRAAQHFGNTTGASNASAQYVIATAHGNSASGFGRQYCAWHSSTSSALVGGNLAYTNLPYITDAGASCGAGFNGLGPDAGITIVEGHELAETMTDPFPSTGWLDSAGAEIGDKCAWISSGQGAAADIALSTGTFAVQSLWSNAFNGGAGGCVLSY